MKNSDDPDDPIIQEALARGEASVMELDKIMREKFKDDPKALAEREEAIRIEPVVPKPKGSLKLKKKKKSRS